MVWCCSARRVKLGWRKEESGSFSEEKEPKRLLDALRGSGSQRGLVAPVEKSLFASFSSEKEESYFLCSTLSAAIRQRAPLWKRRNYPPPQRPENYAVPPPVITL
jgi:hypothetical protein